MIENGKRLEDRLAIIEVGIEDWKLGFLSNSITLHRKYRKRIAEIDYERAMKSLAVLNQWFPDETCPASAGKNKGEIIEHSELFRKLNLKIAVEERINCIMKCYYKFILQKWSNGFRRYYGEYLFWSVLVEIERHMLT